MFDNQWIFKINEIYERIKTQSMDQKLQVRSTKIIHSFKICVISANFLLIIATSTIYWINFIPSISYIYGYIEFILTSLFGHHLVIRNIFISIFISQKYILIFNEINTEIIKSFESFEMNSNDLKSYFNKYYDCCDSLEISNQILKHLYLVLLACLSTGSCYGVFYFIYGNENSFFDLIIQIVFIIFTFLALLLTFMISRVDIEAKTALLCHPRLCIY